MRISAAKNRLVQPDALVPASESGMGDLLNRVLAEAYPAYQRALQQSNAVDFDDLLLHVAALLGENPELRNQLDERFRYILVDEYQDTNLPQYRIVNALSQQYRNLCATGDPDQSIYAWRGAEIGNILRFEKDYPDAVVVRLEHNFRSTKAILREADSLIAHNVHRKAKQLITDNSEGPPVELLTYVDGLEEAEGIAVRIRELVEEAGRPWGDFAIFYRVNALSRIIERSLVRARIPFQVAAGLAFFDRAEVKDIVAYLRLIANPVDRTAFERVVNNPPRGIGKKSQSRLIAWAAETGVSLLDAAARAEEIPKLTKRAIKSLTAFADLIDRFSLDESDSVADLLEAVIEETGYLRGREDHPSDQGDERAANVRELVTAAMQYDQLHGHEGTLEGFLEESALVNDGDNLNTETGTVTLMTLHAAKGLEYPVVFLVGVEQNLLPHERSLQSDDPKQIEEERRLLFVGMTRAEEQLHLTLTQFRDFRGSSMQTIPSQFLREMNLTSTLINTEIGHDEVAYDEADQTVPDFEDQTDVSREVPLSAHPLLMTGADLLNGTTTPVPIPRGFAVGMEVRHPRHGVGTVVHVDGFGRRRTATVEFAKGERRDFDIDKSPLQPIGLR